MNDILKIILQIIAGIFCIVGFVACINCIAENFMYGKPKHKESGAACLVLNADIIGDKLEYYIRKMQNDIRNGKCVYIDKIVLYSGEESSETSLDEITHMCELLTVDYSNVVFIKGGCNFLFTDGT